MNANGNGNSKFILLYIGIRQWPLSFVPQKYVNYMRVRISCLKFQRVYIHIDENLENYNYNRK